MTRGIGVALSAAALALVLSLPAAAPAQRARPDLTVTALGNPPTAIDAGKTVSIRTTVTNRGRGRAGKSAVLFYLLSGGVEIELKARHSVPALARRKRSQKTTALLVPATTPAGRYRLMACADGLIKVRESNENNNCRTTRGAIAIAGAPGPPATPADTTPPALPVLNGTDPQSPSRTSTTPALRASAEPGAFLTVFTGIGCTGAPLAQGMAGVNDGSLSLAVAVAANATTTFFANARDAAGNVSPCTLQGLSYTHDAVAPGPPALTSTDPESPSANGTPTVSGTSEAGASVRLYVNAELQRRTRRQRHAGGDGAFAIAAAAEANSRQRAARDRGRRRPATRRRARRR